MADKLAQLGLETVRDVLFHLPHRFEDRTQLYTIAQVQPEQMALIEGEIVSSRTLFGRRRSFVCTIEDASGSCQLRFFYVHAGLMQQLSQRGRSVRCFGTLRRASGLQLEMVHPEWQMVPEHGELPMDLALTPIYPTREGVSQSLLRKLIKQAIGALDHNTLELLPDALLQQFDMPRLDEAIRQAHNPFPGQTIDTRRLAFEELLVHILRLKKLRSTWQQDRAIAIPQSRRLVDQLVQSLPFALTAAQRRVLGEINTDLAKPVPMMRLVQGDVGAGKTLVALAAAMSVIEAGQQVALMAPTEILAEQHLANVQKYCQSLGISYRLLTGSTRVSERGQCLDDLISGQCQLLVGTHALFQEAVQFKKLALVIIDEQHRFGVAQRAALVEKGKSAGFTPHQLVMTATPIPRTLAMSAYADLDCSIIDELPPGRTPVQTVAIDQARREQVIERVQHSCRQGQQVYWVCTLIEESESLDHSAAMEVHDELQQSLGAVRVGLLHGRMKSDEKDRVMQQFKAGDLDVLVATTVIEVGVDVPNATLMVIESPERLGLSQLHQLRGRVGRGALSSYCILLYQTGLTQHAKERLDIMRKSNDGFEIARKDLELRGPGEILGVRQSGLLAFRFADLIRDQALVPDVHITAEKLQNDYPHLTDKLIARF